MAVPRISALLMLRSTISTVSAPATCPFRGSITNPTQLLCTLRGRRYRRLTQHLLPGGPLRPYPDRSCTGWTAPAFVGAFGNRGDGVKPRYRVCAPWPAGGNQGRCLPVHALYAIGWQGTERLTRCVRARRTLGGDGQQGCGRGNEQELAQGPVAA